MDDLYFNSGQHIYVRIDGIYYKRTIGIGWQVVTKEHADAVAGWNKLHENQRAAFLPGITEDTTNG